MSKNKKIIEKYDKKGNCVYFKRYNGYEEWLKYDEKGNLIYCKNGYGDESWSEYDGNNREICFKTSVLKVVGWWVYDENNVRRSISQQEFEQIKRIRERKERIEFFKRNKQINRFKLMKI